MRHRKPLEECYEINTLGCWLWKLGKTPNGYGKVKFLGKTITAHKYVFELLVRKVTPGMYLDHFRAKEGCPKHCVNPEHLEEVTPVINTQRSATKLTMEKAREIRKLASEGLHYSVLAPMFSIAERTIRNVIANDRWIE